MGYHPNDPYYRGFTTCNPTTGAPQNADSLPVATANRNGADVPAFTLAVANLDTGRYMVSGTIPSGYAGGDVLNVSVAATVGGQAGKAWIDRFVLDTPAAAPTDPLAVSVPGAYAAGTAGYLLGQIGSPVTLSAAGLDAISTTPPAGVAANFREMLIATYRRFFGKSVKDLATHTIRTYADDGTTVVTTQTWSDDNAGNETLGTSS